MIDTKNLRTLTQDFKLAGTPVFVRVVDMNEILDRIEMAEQEHCDATSQITQQLSRLADENVRLRARIEEMEQQKPAAWMLNCQTLGGDTGWMLSWTQSGAGMCNRLSGEENERKLYTLPGAQGEPK